MRVLVVGGGAIGACVAQALTERSASAVVVERNEVAGAASGKSGGFLALDWCDGSPLRALARRSFALHARLAAELGGDWGYRRMSTFAGTFGRGGARGAGLGWLSPEVAIEGRIGTAGTTAQVHPAAFTRAMLRAAEAGGAALCRGEAVDLVLAGDRVTGLRLADGSTLAGDAVVVAMGPWSTLAARWMALPPVFGLKGHSLVFDTGAALPAEALFLDYAEPAGSMVSPEFFPRADGTTYVCGISSEPPVPLDPADVAADPGALERLHALCGRVSPALAAAPVLARQACFRPVTADGLPLIGAVLGLRGAFVATGHSVWGILNAPATGEAVAELVLDGAARTLDLARFAPARLAALDPARVAIARARGPVAAG